MLVLYTAQAQVMTVVKALSRAPPKSIRRHHRRKNRFPFKLLAREKCGFNYELAGCLIPKSERRPPPILEKDPELTPPVVLVGASRLLDVSEPQDLRVAPRLFQDLALGSRTRGFS